MTHTANSTPRVGTIQKVKCILFACADGSVIGLPLQLVAEARAKYYAARDPDTTFEEEVKYVMEDDYEGIDWFRNNQDPEDFSGHYIEFQRPLVKTIEQRVAEGSAHCGEIELFVPNTPPEETL